MAVDATRVLTLRLAERSQLREPMPRRFRARVAPDQGGRELVFEGGALEVRFQPDFCSWGA